MITINVQFLISPALQKTAIPSLWLTTSLMAVIVHANHFRVDVVPNGAISLALDILARSGGR